MPNVGLVLGWMTLLTLHFWCALLFIARTVTIIKGHHSNYKNNYKFRKIIVLIVYSSILIRSLAIVNKPPGTRTFHSHNPHKQHIWEACTFSVFYEQ